MTRKYLKSYGVKFSILLFPPLIFLFVISTWLFHMEKESELGLIRQSQKFNIEQQQDLLEHEVLGAAQDLLFLASLNDIRQVIEQRESGHFRSLLASEFKALMEYKGIYDQIRLLDENGKEAVRVNYRSGVVEITPDSRLQFKRERYYFTDTMKKGREEVFISRLDLNVEQGEIEQPLKPVFRIGTPVFDSQNRKRGIVIINYLGSNLIKQLGKIAVSSPGHFMLLNSEGYWLKGMDASDEWGFMFAERKGRTMGKQYPAAWKRISSEESGQFTNSNGLYTFSTVTPKKLFRAKLNAKNMRDVGTLAETDNLQWKLVRHVPPDALYARVFSHRNGYIIVNTIIVLIWVVIALLLTRGKLYREEAQRALHEKEEKISEIVNTAFDGIITINERGIIETFNPAACDMFDYQEEEVVGQKVNMLMPSPDREYHDLHIQNYLESGVGKFVGNPGQVTAVKKDGSTFPIEICIGAKKIRDQWLFTGICRLYQRRDESDEHTLPSHQQPQPDSGDTEAGEEEP